MACAERPSRSAADADNLRVQKKIREERMRMVRRQFLRLAAGAAALAPGLARAEAFPSRPIRLVLPFPPGGAFDILGRPWADQASRRLGTVIVENLSGAGGSLAAASVAHSPPDGYRIFLGSSAIHLTDMILRVHPLLNPMKELMPISMLATVAFSIAVNPNVPAKSLGELIAYIKANPGKLSYGTPGAGTMNHLCGELLKSLTGIKDLPHVAYRGAGPAITDAIGGQVPIIIPSMTNAVLAFHRTGKLRLLAITNPTRLPIAPDIPTTAEAGVKGLVAQQLIGLFAPAGTPELAVGKLAATNRAALADKAYVQSLIEAAAIPVADEWSAERFDHFMGEEVARWDPLVKAIGVKLD
jgi:tripartite-type tricarboxylate transporter receptor subunit TctC